MNVIIITEDRIFARMLYLEISAFCPNVEVAESLSEEAKAAVSAADFTVLDAEIFAGMPADSTVLESTQVVLFGRPEALDAVSPKIAAGFRIFTRPFSITNFIASFFEKSDETDFGVRVAKHRKSAADSLILNEKEHTVSYKRETAELTKREFALLLYLINNKGATVTRAQAAKAIWEKDGTDTNIVDVYVRYLREKLDEKFGIKLISTVRGIGYTIKTE